MGEEGGVSQSHGSVGEPQVVTGQGLMPTRFYLTLPTLQGVERKLWSAVCLLISFYIIAVISSCSLLTQPGSLSTEETEKGVHGNFAWPAEHKAPCARFTLVQLPSQSTFSRAQHAVTQAVSFPATASYFLVNGLQLIANGSRTGQTPDRC